MLCPPHCAAPRQPPPIFSFEDTGQRGHTAKLSGAGDHWRPWQLAQLRAAISVTPPSWKCLGMALQNTQVWQSKCISAFCNPPPGCAVSPRCHQGSAQGEHLLAGAGVVILSCSERLEFESVFLLHTSPTCFHTRNISYDLQIPVVLLQIKKKSLSKNTQIFS